MADSGSVFRFHLVDDDPDFRAFLRVLLQGGGHEVSESDSATHALGRVVAQPPDCILIDLMLPGTDGLELCRRLRDIPELINSKLVILTAKSYGFDFAQASRHGADAYLVKPIDQRSFLGAIERIVRDELRITFWGVRGMLPVPGSRTVRYGGNTPCVSLEYPCGRLFVFDAGSGIKGFSDSLSTGKARKRKINLLISHAHSDHINALPFLGPLYESGNEIDVYGPGDSDGHFAAIVSTQMDSAYSPITWRDFAANLRCYDLLPGRHQIDGIEVQTLRLNHPGHCLGYRVNYGGKSVCYVTDNEIYPNLSKYYNANFVRLLKEFWADANLLVTDTTFTEEEYRERIGWGHSSVTRVARLAHDAGASHLCLFHHDPDQDDDAIDAKLRSAQAQLAELGSNTRCSAPAEGESILL